MFFNGGRYFRNPLCYSFNSTHNFISMVSSKHKESEHDKSIMNMFNGFTFKKKNEKIDWRKIGKFCFFKLCTY